MGIVWMVKAIPVPPAELDVAVSLGQWEPFAVFDDSTLWVKAQIHTEDDEERSSAHRDLGESFAQEDLPE